MKPLYLLTAEPLSGPLQADISTLQSALQSDPLTTVQFAPGGTPPKEYIRHILLGSPSAIRHTIHLLHRLHYAEPTLWTPVLTLDEPLTLSPAPGEAMSLLRKPIQNCVNLQSDEKFQQLHLQDEQLIVYNQLLAVYNQLLQLQAEQLRVQNQLLGVQAEQLVAYNQLLRLQAEQLCLQNQLLSLQD